MDPERHLSEFGYKQHKDMSEYVLQETNTNAQSNLGGLSELPDTSC
jgi:hypothetical protein